MPMKLKDLEAFALSLPGATLEFPFGPETRVYKVGGKMFALSGGALGAPARVSFKCSDIAYEMLVAQDGLCPAPYLARAKWVRLEDPAALGAEELKARIGEAHRLVIARLPKKARPA
jgi:predicted DNA-binding protein (MmcQ/YjbR family)